MQVADQCGTPGDYNECLLTLPAQAQTPRASSTSRRISRV